MSYKNKLSFLLLQRRANLRRRSMLGQNLSSPVDVSSSGDDCSLDPEPSGTKRSRKKLQQHDVVLAENSEHASVSEMDTPLSALCQSRESNHPGSRFSEKNSLQVTCHRAVSSAPMNGLVCASPGHSIPQNRSIPNSAGETVDKPGVLSEMMDSDGQLNTDVYSPSGGDSHDKLSIVELREKMASARRNARRNNSGQWAQKKVLSVKTLKVKKGISKSKGGKAHPMHELQGNNDVSDNIQFKGNINFSSKDIVCALIVPVEGQTTKTPAIQVQTLDMLSIDVHGNVLDEEPTAMINSISQVNINADLCTNHATIQRAKRNHLMESAILSADHPILEAGRKVDERSIRPCLLHNAANSQATRNNSPLRSCSTSGSSKASPFHVSQDHQVLFEKGDMWHSIEAEDVFKEFPQQPHFLPLQELSPPLREGMAVGLMLSFANLVKNIRKASMDCNTELFEHQISSLSYLEQNGFDVQFLRSTLTKMLQVKLTGSSYLREVHNLKAQIVGMTASSSQVDALLDEKDTAIAQLEQKLGRLRQESQKLEQKLGCLRQESQKIAKEKEHDEAVLSELQVSCSRCEQGYGDANREFNFLAELHQKRLT
ncbi:hypothetical protein HU200_038202 [Digitaria exilis]|uniref:Uncharacterized protein n=1 Tax=Digitaria exilis TaxID=1010633 RepID=A0A835BE18_9POAL|nr:hypothetical protein HU200_038202 [Digitaria exilis]